MTLANRWNIDKHFCFASFLSVYLHACRALAVIAVITGFFGGVLTLIGMKCTKIGGSEIANARVTFAGALTYLISGKNIRFLDLFEDFF